MDVGDPVEARLDPLANLLLALEPPASRPRPRHLHDAVLGEEGHDRVDVVGVERVQERFEHRDVYLVHWSSCEDAPVPTDDATRLAVLIDADNSTASVTTELLEEVAKYGTPTIKRAYGDWTTPHLGGWKDELLGHAIQPMQQFAYTAARTPPTPR